MKSPMRQRLFSAALSGLLLSACIASAEPTVTRIAFGSCANQDKPQPIWEAIRRERPEAFLFLGDNIYADTDDISVMARKYRRLAEQPGFAALRREAKVLATWDDHDYGRDDVGEDYAQKTASRGLLLEFFEEPAESPRWDQPGGIYTAHTFGSPGRRVQVILLDLRWARSRLRHVARELYEKEHAPKKLGPYLPLADSSSRLMSEEQWTWLEARLREPAEVRLIGSSIQCLAEFTGWESWANLPHERARLLSLIASTQANGVILLSGDTHWTELSRVAEGVSYPLWELTSSGLTEVWSAISPNRHRIGPAYAEPNYGLVAIDWDAAEPLLTLASKSAAGAPLIEQKIRLSELRPSP
ncbi:MAG TPA: alkaline phosphatase D family protein [Opitutaceae bacterium]